MFVRNYYKYQSYTFAGTTIDGVLQMYTETDGTTGPSIYNSTSTSINSYGGSAIRTMMGALKGYDVKTTQQTSTSGYVFSYGAVMGTGTTKPTIGDYTLSGDVVTGFSYSVSLSKIIGDDYTNASYTALYTITNTNEEAITIGEIGLFGEQRYQSKTTTGTSPTPYHHGFVMFERTVLEEPLIIEAGGVGQLTYTISMNLPVPE